MIELYAKNPGDGGGEAARDGLVTRLRRRAAELAALRQRDLEEHHALDRQAPRAHKHEVLLQRMG